MTVKMGHRQALLEEIMEQHALGLLEQLEIL